MPATPFAIPTRVASGISKASVYLNIISFDTSRAVKERTLPGNAPIAEVPKPRKRPGIPSFLNMCLATDIPPM
jgi:hypothetical protein